MDRGTPHFMNEIEALTKRLDLIVQALDSLRKLTELNEQRIVNLEHKVLEIPPQEDTP